MDSHLNFEEVEAERGEGLLKMNSPAHTPRPPGRSSVGCGAYAGVCLVALALLVSGGFDSGGGKRHSHSTPGLLRLSRSLNASTTVSAAPGSACYGTAFPASGAFTASPPYWLPHDCPGRAPLFTAAAWRACMASRGGGRLFVSGNSIGRGIAFAAADLLSNRTHHPGARFSQRDACAKSKAPARGYENPHVTNRVSCVIPVGGDDDAVGGDGRDDAVRFLWKPHAWATTWMSDDFCAGEDPRGCWRRFSTARASRATSWCCSRGWGTR